MTAAIIVPTRCRVDYLRVTLSSLMPQARAAGIRVVVVDDADEPDAAVRALADAWGATLARGPARGINGARNAGVAAAVSAHHTPDAGPLRACAAAWLFFLDDDVEVHAGWLAALLDAAASAPDDVDFLTGPIRARFEDHRLRSCGRERPPITTFDLGAEDTDAPVAWGVNMGIRRSVLDLVGPFDERLVNGGDEEELQQRWRTARPRGRIRYVAAAGVDHRRAGDDARLRSLARAARSRGQAARRYDVRRGVAPSLRHELAVLARCALHVPYRRCVNGIVLTAHALGRLDEARAPTRAPALPGVDDFLSGASGSVGGWRGRMARAHDAWLDITMPRSEVDGLEGHPRVLVVGIDRPTVESTMAATLAELRRSTFADVTVRTSFAGSRGKFENLNALLAAEDLGTYDWLVVVDDDIDLPRGFLDRFLTHADGAKLAQPAHRLYSHAAWPHTRRRRGSLVRPTTFVEIGPLTAFHRDTFATLFPFPDVRMGWGLDAHWAAVARDAGWPMAIVDATPIGHTLRPVAATYPRAAALQEARSFLRGRTYLTRAEVR